MRLNIEFTGFTQKLLLNETPFVAHIYDGNGEPPSGFNVARIALDGSEHSLLDWRDEIERAHTYVQKGLLILWEVQFSLLNGSWEDEARFLALNLSMQHFIDTVLPLFQNASFGVALYRGSCNLCQSDDLLNHLKMLAAALPDEISSFLFLDTTECTEPETYFSMICHERYGHFKLLLKGPCCEKYPYATAALAWGGAHSPLGYCSDHCASPMKEQRISRALCLPPLLRGQLHSILAQLKAHIPYRVIPEALLEQEWEGIEQLFIIPDLVSEMGWRKIRGFMAAGGEVTKLQH